MQDRLKDGPYKDLTGGRHHSVVTLPSRKAEVHVMRLRARQSALLRGYLSGKAEAEVECKRCKLKQTLEHILQECEKTVQQRSRMLGTHTLKELMTREVVRTHQYLHDMGYFDEDGGETSDDEEN
eukprot:TRINITY_DN47737_c0_g1_i1.p1 TRINITY_DN47737_c0_g1~~TRINITY_DN47737_c0_g1_i1.p1  ORF type:complete len:125 (+),score=28.66 TRINITY_DN47737_c0_g1_i1:124-498(+)